MTTATVRIEDSPETGSVIATLEDGTVFAIEVGEFEKAHGKTCEGQVLLRDARAGLDSRVHLALSTFERWLDKESQWCEVETR